MKRISIFGLALVLAISVASCGNSQSQHSAQATAVENTGAIVKNVSPAEFKTLVETKQGVILDVRTPQEVAQGAIEGHVNMNFYAPDFKDKLQTLDKNVPVMVYCKTGGRSGNTMQVLKSMGFKEVYNLSGGIIAWKSQGMPIK